MGCPELLKPATEHSDAKKREEAVSGEHHQSMTRPSRLRRQREPQL